MGTVARVSCNQGAVGLTSLFKIHIFFNVVEFLFQPDERNESGGGKAPSHISSLFICGVADTPAERRLVLKQTRRELHGDPAAPASTW